MIQCKVSGRVNWLEKEGNLSKVASQADSNNIRAIDLFCGAGGSSWGAKRAGATIVAGFDMSEVAGKTYRDNFPDAKFYPGRIESTDIDKIAKDLGPIDIILASPECTNHSPAKGNRDRCEESKNTAFLVLKFVQRLKPRWVVIENVVSMRKWTRYEELKACLEDLEYNLREQILDASHFGVPQTRRRLFLLCDREMAPEKVKKRKRNLKNIGPLLNMDGRFGWSPLYTERRARNTLERAERGILEIGPNQPFLLVYYGSDHAGGWQELSRPLRTITTVDRFAVVKPTPDGPMMRMLQVPELRKAMGMTGMVFRQGTRRDQIKMIGNAVCPPVMETIVRQLKRKK